MDPKGTAVKATAMSREAWDVVLDAGRRPGASSDVWAELGERGMAKGRELTPPWRDVVAGLSRADAQLEVLARSGAMRFRTTLSVMGTLCLLETSRERVVGEGEVTREPRVLVQIVRPESVFDAVSRVLPPVDALRADDRVADEVGVPVPATDLPFGGEAVSLDERGAGPVGATAGVGEPTADGGWLSAAELTEGHQGDDLRPDEAMVRAFAALLGEMADEPSADESADALASVPGVDPRLAEMLRGPETEVIVLRSPGRRGARSAEGAMQMLGGLALRQWVVTDEGLVAVRADIGGVRVLGVEPGDLADEVRRLVAGAPADIEAVAEYFGEDS